VIFVPTTLILLTAIFFVTRAIIIAEWAPVLIALGLAILAGIILEAYARIVPPRIARKAPESL
jgi:hypothetical protein